MSDKPKAIPTEYAGVQFRSRLEAQFAFLLDRLGWKWEYEAFSLLLPCGETFIPDFWIPAFRLIIECRGYRSDRGDAQIDGMEDMLGPRFEGFAVVGPEECRIRTAERSSTSLIFGMCQCGLWFPVERKNQLSDCRCFVPNFVAAVALSIKAGKLFLNKERLEDFEWPT